MAETTYNYTFAVDFTSGFNSTNMLAEIQASAIVTAIERIDTDATDVDIVFKDALSAGDQIILDNNATPGEGLVGAHDPVQGSPTWAVDIVDVNETKLAADLTIAGAASLSAATTVLNKVSPSNLVMDGWTSAVMSFDVSMDGVTFVPLLDITGEEYVTADLNVVNTGTVGLPLDATVFRGWKYMKIRSGTKGTPVNQASLRTIEVWTRSYA